MTKPMTRNELRQHLSDAIIGLIRGYSKVQADPKAPAWAGLWLGLLTARNAMDGDPQAARVLRELGESNVRLSGLEAFFVQGNAGLRQDGE